MTQHHSKTTRWRAGFTALFALALGGACACSTGVTEDRADATPAADSAPDVDGTAEADSMPVVDSLPGIDTVGNLTTIADLRGMADGTRDLVLLDVYATYLSNIGYYIQDAQSGPALFVYLSAAPTVAVGNKVNLQVTSLTTYHGLKEIDGSAILANDNGSYDVIANLSQDLSAGTGTVPAEAHESELVTITGATITSGTSLVYEVQYGSTPVTANFRASSWETHGLCVGATLDAVGIVDEDDGTYTIRNFHDADVTNVNTSGCS